MTSRDMRVHANRYVVAIAVRCPECDHEVTYLLPKGMNMIKGQGDYAVSFLLDAMWNGCCKDKISWDKIELENL